MKYARRQCKEGIFCLVSDVVQNAEKDVSHDYIINMSLRRTFASLFARRSEWSMPHSPQHIASTVANTELPPPLPARPVESLQTLRARLLYQSRKRGTLENDLLLSTFASEHLNKMDENELREYDSLLNEPDWDIYYWSTGKTTPPERWQSSSLLRKLALHARNDQKQSRRMPSL